MNPRECDTFAIDCAEQSCQYIDVDSSSVDEMMRVKFELRRAVVVFQPDRSQLWLVRSSVVRKKMKRKS
jgi:hypothetical protein